MQLLRLLELLVSLRPLLLLLQPLLTLPALLLLPLQRLLVLKLVLLRALEGPSVLVDEHLESDYLVDQSAVLSRTILQVRQHVALAEEPAYLLHMPD